MDSKTPYIIGGGVVLAGLAYYLYTKNQTPAVTTAAAPTLNKLTGGYVDANGSPVDANGNPLPAAPDFTTPPALTKPTPAQQAVLVKALSKQSVTMVTESPALGLIADVPAPAGSITLNALTAVFAANSQGLQVYWLAPTGTPPNDGLLRGTLYILPKNVEAPANAAPMFDLGEVKTAIQAAGIDPKPFVSFTVLPVDVPTPLPIWSTKAPPPGIISDQYGPPGPALRPYGDPGTPPGGIDVPPDTSPPEPPQTEPAIPIETQSALLGLLMKETTDGGSIVNGAAAFKILNAGMFGANQAISVVSTADKLGKQIYYEQTKSVPEVDTLYIVDQGTGAPTPGAQLMFNPGDLAAAAEAAGISLDGLPDVEMPAPAPEFKMPLFQISPDFMARIASGVSSEKSSGGVMPASGKFKF